MAGYSVVSLCLMVVIAVGSNTYRDVEQVKVAVGLPHTGHQMGLTHRKHLNTLDTLLDHGTVERITITITTTEGKELFTNHLLSSPLLLPKSLKVAYFDDNKSNSIAKNLYIGKNNFSCFYADSKAVGQQLSYFQLCNGGLEGEISVTHDTTVYHIEMSVQSDGELHFLMNTKETRTSSPGKCGNKDSLGNETANHTLHRSIRSAKLTHAPANSDDLTRYIELYVVLDNELYKRSGSDLIKTVQRAVLMVNYASSLFKQMNIYLALVGTEVWTKGNKFVVTGDAQTVLDKFELYRMYDISPQTPNDNANLFVAERFADLTIGQGSVSMCVELGGVAITADHYEDNKISAATTMVHELGHNLGLAHDDSLLNSEECVCPRTDVDDDKCIMHSKSDSLQPIEWSQCSIDSVHDSFTTRGTDYCLKNLPDSATLVESCGNYFVDEGEECDCGPAEECESKCCEPLTCKFTSGSKCATGDCCNKTTCQLKKATTVCREIYDEACDLTEYCDGKSEWCPADTYMSNGMECSNEPKAYCYEGQCRTRDTQCKFVWGDESKSSRERCYTRWNPIGQYYGNCGYTVVNDSAGIEYKSCDPADAMCGMLQCEAVNEEGVLGLKTRINYYNNKVTVNGTNYPCSVVIFDVGIDTADPGLVPDGAACNTDHWCQEQRCVDRPVQPGYCNCSGEGVCNQYNECHCNDGLNPVDNCLSPGPGGSIRSGPQSVYLPPTTTTSPPDKSQGWVTPVVVTIIVLLVVAAIVAVIVIKRRQVKDLLRKHNPRLFKRYPSTPRPQKASRTNNSATKFGSLPTSSASSSRRHDYISNPILESTTNQSMNLRDIPATTLSLDRASTPPTLSLDPVSNPTYSSPDICIEEEEESAPLTSREDKGHTYSECRFGSDSGSDSEDVNAYEDMVYARTQPA